MVDEAESVLKKSDLSVECVVSMLLEKVAKDGLPVNFRICEESLSFERMAPEEAQKEIDAGIEEFEKGRVFTQEEARDIFKWEFGL